MPPGVLCNATRDLQRCMTPLMHLDADKIVEASLLGLQDEGSRMLQTSQEEAVLLEKGPEAQGAATPPHKSVVESHSEESIKQSNTPHPPASSAIASLSNDQPSTSHRVQCRTRPRHAATPDLLEHPHEWVRAYLAKRDKPLSWWPEF